jgi:short-subunit dehydrogenase
MAFWFAGTWAGLLGLSAVVWKRSLPMPLPLLLRPWVIALCAGLALVTRCSAAGSMSPGVIALAAFGFALAGVVQLLPTSLAQKPASKLEFRDRWVLVTGASAGLGREFARQLAKEHGAHLMLLARRKDRLEELQAELEQNPGVKVIALVADLSKPADVERVLEQIVGGPSLHAVILNAAITYFGPHEQLDANTFRALLETNVASVVRFASVLVPDLLSRAPGGGLMFVSSVAGLQPAPYQSVYSGTKAFMNHFAFGLWHELRGRDLSITTFAPGGIATEMTATDNFRPLAAWLMPAAVAAREGLEAFQRRDYLFVPGFVNRLGAGLTRILPRRLVTALIAREYRRALEISTRATAP